MKTLSVYIHVPFCVKKCHYCDFLSAPANRETINQYVSALKKEICAEANRYKDYQITSVFFGGGTPSILDGQDIVEVMDSLSTAYHIVKNAEITIEMNPATATREKMLLWQKAGINRLSIGLQSANDEELKMLGRIHTYQDFIQSYRLAREVGFQNISVDLMSGLPGQTLESWETTLMSVLEINPEHISAYSLIIEEGTKLYNELEQFPPVPAEEVDRKMYGRTKEILAEYGYERYEISNYAKAGFESRHNSVYWERGNYVGFGLGASSMVDDVRWSNTADFHKYIHDSKEPLLLQENVEELSTTDCMEEFMFLGLRMMKGVKKSDFARIFSTPIEQVYGDILSKWESEGMLVIEEDSIFLTDLGIDVSNVIFSDFLA